MLETRLGVVALLLSNEANWRATKTRETADNGCVLAKQSIAGKWREIGDKTGNEIRTIGQLRMAGDKRLLPGRQAGIEIGERFLGTNFEPGQIFAPTPFSPSPTSARNSSTLVSSSATGFFKIEIGAHKASQVNRAGRMPRI